MVSNWIHFSTRSLIQFNLVRLLNWQVQVAEDMPHLQQHKVWSFWLLRFFPSATLLVKCPPLFLQIAKFKYMKGYLQMHHNKNRLFCRNDILNTECNILEYLLVKYLRFTWIQPIQIKCPASLRRSLEDTYPTPTFNTPFLKLSEKKDKAHVCFLPVKSHPIC